MARDDTLTPNGSDDTSDNSPTSSSNFLDKPYHTVINNDDVTDCNGLYLAVIKNTNRPISISNSCFLSYNSNPFIRARTRSRKKAQWWCHCRLGPVTLYPTQ